MHTMNSGNIRYRKNKVGLSSDSCGLGRLGITKYSNAIVMQYSNAALVNMIANVFAMMNHRGFFVLTKGD